MRRPHLILAWAATALWPVAGCLEDKSGTVAVSAVDYEVEYAVMWCQAAFRCPGPQTSGVSGGCLYGFTDEASCVDAARSGLLGSEGAVPVADIEAGITLYDATRAGRCIAATRVSLCEADLDEFKRRRVPEACLGVVEGTLPKGATCTGGPYQCQPGLICDRLSGLGGPTGTNTCLPLDEALGGGGALGGLGGLGGLIQCQPSCDDGFYCAPDGECAPLAGAGEPCQNLLQCDRSKGLGCALAIATGPDGAATVVGTCTAIQSIARGEACTSTAFCEGALVCGEAGQCEAYSVAGAGEACDARSQLCAAPNGCIDDLCQPPAAPGGACDFAWNCESGFACEASRCVIAVPERRQCLPFYLVGGSALLGAAAGPVPQ